MKAAPDYFDHGLKQIKELDISYNFLSMQYIDQSIEEYIDQTDKEKLKIGQISVRLLEAIEEFH